MTPIDKLLPRLDKVCRGKPSQWRACCPAHDDRNPSLSITEISDGTLLLKCWAGCSAAEIVTAVGLTLRDLFPNCVGRHPRRGPSQQAIQFERVITECGRLLMEAGTTLPVSDRERLELARRRLAKLGGRV
jgi:hypothetical protein